VEKEEAQGAAAGRAAAGAGARHRMLRVLRVLRVLCRAGCRFFFEAGQRRRRTAALSLPAAGSLCSAEARRRASVAS
jgi:hypothetical protein